MTCPTPDELVQGWNDRLDEDAAARQRDHVAWCDACSELEAEWRTISLAGQCVLVGNGDRSRQCPDEMLFVEHVAGRLVGNERERLVSHVAECRHCTGLLAEAAIGFDEALPDVRPSDRDVVRATHRLVADGVASSPKRESVVPTSRWFSATAAAAALVLLVVGGLVPVTTNDDRTSSLRQQVTPMITIPELTTPRAGQRIRRDSLAVRWHGVVGARVYRVSILTDRGDSVWETVVPGSEVQVPASAPLVPGARYFVWVIAELESGREVRSRSVAFEVVAGPLSP